MLYETLTRVIKSRQRMSHLKIYTIHSYFEELAAPTPTPSTMSSRQTSAPVSRAEPVTAGQYDLACRNRDSELKACLTELDVAINSEDFQKASRLKKDRDHLQSRQIPPKPCYTSDSSFMFDPKLHRSQVGSSTSSTSTTRNDGINGIFTLWTH